MMHRLKKLFIPSEENGFKPTFLERLSMGVMFALVLLSFVAANVQALLWIGSEYLVSTVLPSIIVELTNDSRSENTLNVLVRSPVLDAAAQMKAEHMAEHEYFAHYSPDGTSPWYWFDQVSYDFVHAGENLAVHFTDSGDVVEAWMQSPSHRDNILNGNYTEIGVGTAQGEYKGFPTVYVVQLFGTPRADVSVLAVHEGGAVLAETAVSDNVSETITLETTNEPTEVDGEGDSGVAQASLETASVTGTPETTIEEVTVEDTIVAYSDLATTSRSGIAAPIDNVAANAEVTPQNTKTNILLQSAVRPSLWLQAVYGVLAVFVFLALSLSVFIEWRRQHPVQVAYAGGMFAVMASLLYIHIVLTGGAVII